MKLVSRLPQWWALAAASMGLALAQQTPPPDEHALIARREQALDGALKPFQELATKYRAALEKRLSEAQSAGNLDAVLVLKAELKVLAEKDGVGDPPASTELAKMRQAYLDQKARLVPPVEKAITEAERDYAAGLEKLVATLTQAGKTEEAKRIRDNRDEFVKEFQARKQKGLIATLLQAPKAGSEREFEIAPGFKVTFCWIPPGKFIMGFPASEVGGGSAPQREVTITRGFWMAKTECTNEQWEAVMGNRPSHNKQNGYPVEQVSWNDICGNAERAGGFLAKAGRVAPQGWRFDLPTEAEWEYACRAGTTTSLNSGENITVADGVCPNLDKVAWYDKNSGGGSKPVGGKLPNKWGLHDMHANVWEWIIDWKAPPSSEAATDPTGPPSGTERQFRGGSWRHNPAAARSGARWGYYRPEFRYLTLGFRPILRQIPQAPPEVVAKQESPPPAPAKEQGMVKPVVTTSTAPHSAGFGGTVPAQTGPPRVFEGKVLSEASEGRYVYATPHFEFISDRKLSERVVAGFGVIFEATYETVKAMPWDCALDPGDSRDLFEVRLFTKEEDFLSAGGLRGSDGTAVGPLCLVLMSSLGVKDTGNRIILEDVSDNHVLIHELTHALRNHADSNLPVWAVEGFAEYIASAPYQRGGHLSFKDRLADAARHAKTKSGVGEVFIPTQGLDELLDCTKARFYAGMENPQGNTQLENYALALLAMTYFWHADKGKDDSRSVGAPIRAWLKAIQEGKSEQEARPSLLDGRTIGEIETAMTKAFRPHIRIEFKRR